MLLKIVLHQTYSNLRIFLFRNLNLDMFFLLLVPDLIPLLLLLMKLHPQSRSLQIFHLLFGVVHFDFGQVGRGESQKMKIHHAAQVGTLLLFLPPLTDLDQYHQVIVLVHLLLDILLLSELLVVDAYLFLQCIHVML